MSDVISRQVAISAICGACGKIDCDKMDKCEKLQLPPANNSEIPNSSDTISRQAALDIALKYCPDDDGTCSEAGSDMRNMLDEIEALPPAEPERIKGRWTRDNACSECGCQPWFSGDIHNYNFCPNCGAEMEVTT